MQRILLPGLLVVWIAGPSACSCTGEPAFEDTGVPWLPDSTPADATTFADAAAPDADSGAVPDGGEPDPTDPYPPGLCPDAPAPSGIPDGWQRYDGFSCWCPLYVPTELAEPVEAIRWEACPPAIPATYQCRSMVYVDGSGVPFVSTFYPAFYRDPQGRGLLQFGRVRLDSDLRYRLVAELDGPVRVAFLQATPSGVCELGDNSLAGSHYLFRVIGPRDPGGGIIGGEIGARYPDPRFVRAGMDTSTFIWTATPAWLVTLGSERTAESWDGATRLSLSDLPASGQKVFGAGSALFVESSSQSSVAVWTPVTGAAPFLPRPSDTPQSRVTGNFMTDGKDMVWFSAVRGAGGVDVSTMELWTAPFTTDRQELESTAHRVVGFPYGVDVFPLALGCGYAARVNRNHAEPGPNLVVVRLRDGAKFEIGAKSKADGWEVDHALGVHCSPEGGDPEVIVVMTVPGGPPAVIARFPIAPLEASPDRGL